MSVDYPSTCKNSICLVSRDSYLSKNASWAHKPILIKTNITTILQLSPNNSIVDYTFIQHILKSTILIHIIQKLSKPQPGFLQNRSLRRAVFLNTPVLEKNVPSIGNHSKWVTLHLSAYAMLQFKHTLK